MSATLTMRQNPPYRITPRKLSRGTIVRVKNQTGHFTVTSVAGWGGPDYALPICYNLLHHEERKFVVQPAGILEPLKGEELDEANRIVEALKEPPAHQRRHQNYIPPFERMLAAPDRTRKMARHFFGDAAAATMEIPDLAKLLVPKYRITHCWKCRSTLNNLELDLCPKCGGITCTCGKCLCDSPWCVGRFW